MPHFKAEVTSEMKKELEKFLEKFDLTKAEFLRLAINYKEQMLLSIQEELHTKGIVARVQALQHPSRKVSSPSRSSSAISKKAQSTLIKKKKKKKVQSPEITTKPDSSMLEKKTPAPPMIPESSSMQETFETMQVTLETNRKLFETFRQQAKAKGLTQQQYARKLRLDLVKIRNIKSSKSIDFIPKLEQKLTEEMNSEKQITAITK